jgi:Cytochrome c7 and related cytochrome c/Cytochrome c3
MKKFILPAIIVLVMALMVQFPRWMISPGQLVQGHAQLSGKCLACHTPFAGVTNEKCIACHQTAGIGKDSLQVASMQQAAPPLFHEGLGDQACTSCHVDHRGALPDASTMHFQHGLLTEATLSACVNCHAKPENTLHLQVSSSCKSCHTTAGWAASATFDHEMIVGTDKANCVTCHNKPDNQLHLQLSTQCSSCHTTAAWKSGVAFDHNMIQGADKDNCALCHQKPSNAFHASSQDNCAKCHGTAQWLPSTFDHSKFFVLDAAHNASCKTCHATSDFAVYTCFGCHEHTESNIRAEHSEEGITNTNDCVRCHASANEDEIRRIEGGEGGLNPEEANRVRDYIKGNGENGSGDDD